MKSRRSARPDKTLFYEIVLQAYKDQLQMEIIMTSNMFALMKNGHFLEEKKEGKVLDISGPWEWSFSCFKCYSKKVKHLMV